MNKNDIPHPGHESVLRHLWFPEFGELLIWDTYRRVPGPFPRWYLGYAFWPTRRMASATGTVDPLFYGINGTAADEYIDSNSVVRSAILGVSMRPGDTDPDYFDDYTAEQLEWANRYGEEFGCFSVDPENEEHEDELHQYDVREAKQYTIVNTNPADWG